jgi:hypothetical protein
MGARAFFIHHGHVAVYHNCPNAIAFQDLYPLANIGYISLLPEGLLAEGSCLLESQKRKLLCASAFQATVPMQAPPPPPPPQSLLDCYVAEGFTHPPPGPPLTSAASSSSNPPSIAGSGLICSPSASRRDYDHGSSTAVSSHSHQLRHSHSSAWRPDPDGYDHSSFGNYGGPHLAYGGSIPCYGGYHIKNHSFQHYGGSLIPPCDIPPYIFPQNDVLVTPWLVPHATALVVSSLGGTVVPLSSLLHADTFFCLWTPI